LDSIDENVERRIPVADRGTTKSDYGDIY